MILLALLAIQEWHPDLAAGKRAAAKSGKPLLLVTMWKPDV